MSESLYLIGDFEQAASQTEIVDLFGNLARLLRQPDRRMLNRLLTGGSGYRVHHHPRAGVSLRPASFARSLGFSKPRTLEPLAPRLPSPEGRALFTRPEAVIHWLSAGADRCGEAHGRQSPCASQSRTVFHEQPSLAAIPFDPPSQPLQPLHRRHLVRRLHHVPPLVDQTRRNSPVLCHQTLPSPEEIVSSSCRPTLLACPPWSASRAAAQHGGELVPTCALSAIGSTIVRAQQHSAGAQKKTARIRRSGDHAAD